MTSERPLLCFFILTILGIVQQHLFYLSIKFLYTALLATCQCQKMETCLFERTFISHAIWVDNYTRSIYHLSASNEGLKECGVICSLRKDQCPLFKFLLYFCAHPGLFGVVYFQKQVTNVTVWAWTDHIGFMLGLSKKLLELRFQLVSCQNSD